MLLQHTENSCGVLGAVGGRPKCTRFPPSYIGARGELHQYGLNDWVCSVSRTPRIDEGHRNMHYLDSIDDHRQRPGFLLDKQAGTSQGLGRPRATVVERYDGLRGRPAGAAAPPALFE